MMCKNFFIISCTIATIHYGCGKNRDPGPTVPAPVVPPVVIQHVPHQGKNYLALGDSYTIGQGVAPADNYPEQTKSWLAANGISDLHEPQIIANLGWSTVDLKTALKNANLTGQFDVVSILIGVNDQYRRIEITTYESNLRQLVQEAVWLAANERSHVFVLSIPDYSVTPFASQLDVKKIANEIEAFNKVNRQIAEAMQVRYLDITASTREAKTNPSLVCPDGLHPSAMEYAKWALKLGPMMKEALK